MRSHPSLRHPCLLLAALALAVPISSESADDGVFVRFQLVQPGTNHYVQLSGNIHVDPWYLPNVTWPTNAGTDATRRVPTGQFTDWFDIRQWAGAKLHGRMSRAGGVAEFPNVNVTFVTGATGVAHRAVIELAIARDEKAVVRRFEESFEGNTTGFLVSPTLAKDAGELETLWQMADRHLRWAREAAGGKRVSPKELILQTSFYGGTVKDAEALWLLGFNLVGNQTAAMHAKFPDLRHPAGHHWVEFGPELTREDVAKQIRSHADKTKPSERMNLFGFSDEIACHARIGTNAAALAHFREWLADQKIAPQDLGVTQWNEVVPIETPEALRERAKLNPKAANRVFYYTSRFRQASATQRIRWLTESFRGHAPGATNVFTSTLVADHPYFSGTGLGMGMKHQNTAWGGWPLALDWFDLARKRAVDAIGIEDWMGLQYMYGPNYTWEGPQLMGFQTSIFRSGSEGAMPVITWITPSNDTNFLLKASSALAQGSKHLFFWTYGPTCHGTENYWSDLRGAYDGFARYARQLAAAEHIIAPGTTRKTRVALLYSISADYWQPFGYIHMLERRAMYLALVHNQYLVDMLTEEDVVAGRLRNYDMLYVTDANIDTKASAAIEVWVRDGGWLYGSCGAGSRNQFDEPAPGLAKAFGIEPAIHCEVQPGRYHIRGSLNELPYLDEIALESTSELGDSASFGVVGVKIGFLPTTSRVIGNFKDRRSAAAVNDFGKGRAVYFAGCPGLSYLKDARFVPKALQEQYPPSQRRLINALAVIRRVPRLVELSHPAVEAGIYDSPNGSAVVLANFTYQPIEKLTLRVPLSQKIQAIRSVERGKLRFRQENASPALKAAGYPWVAACNVSLGLNDVVLLER